MVRCYFESKAYMKDVMVKNQHFRCYHQNKEIEYFQKFRNFMHFNSVCDVPVLQLPPDNTADKPPDLILWNLIPFFKKSQSELLYRCWLHGA